MIRQLRIAVDHQDSLLLAVIIAVQHGSLLFVGVKGRVESFSCKQIQTINLLFLILTLPSSLFLSMHSVNIYKTPIMFCQTWRKPG